MENNSIDFLLLEKILMEPDSVYYNFSNDCLLGNLRRGDYILIEPEVCGRIVEIKFSRCGAPGAPKMVTCNLLLLPVIKSEVTTPTTMVKTFKYAGGMSSVTCRLVKKIDPIYLRDCKVEIFDEKNMIVSTATDMEITLPADEMVISIEDSKKLKNSEVHKWNITTLVLGRNKKFFIVLTNFSC